MTGFFQYLKQKRLETATAIQGRTIIYLDVNFWIALRKAVRKEKGYDSGLLEQVTRLHDTGKFVFPVSEMTFREVMKQADEQSRQATLELIDRFSNGIAIIEMEERAMLETRVWLLKAMKQPVYELNELIWTRLAFILGYRHIMMLPTEELQQAAVESLSDTSLAQLARDIPWTFTYKDDVEKFNRLFKEHAHENKTYEQMFLSELAGVIDVHRELITNAMDSMHNKEKNRYMTPEERAADKTPEVIYNIIRLNKVTDELPLFHIIATLHAWTRWKQKPFKDGNDTIDFYHASFALPYADYFFTDRRLCNAITESGLDKRYHCIVEHNLADVTALLARL